eukprot:353839-Chlamydomonas_euryale.AAC.43
MGVRWIWRSHDHYSGLISQPQSGGSCEEEGQSNAYSLRIRSHKALPAALSTVALLALLSQWEWPSPNWRDAILSTP